MVSTFRMNFNPNTFPTVAERIEANPYTPIGKIRPDKTVRGTYLDNDASSMFYDWETRTWFQATGYVIVDASRAAIRLSKDTVVVNTRVVARDLNNIDLDVIFDYGLAVTSRIASTQRSMIGTYDSTISHSLLPRVVTDYLVRLLRT